MNLFPMFARLEGKVCVVVGGGKVAERKIASLLKTGADIRVISPQMTEKIKSWESEGKLRCRYRPFQPEDVEEAVLVIAATDRPEVNLQVYRSVKPHQWINIADRPDLCSFFVPAVVERGDLQIAISTGGKYAGLAKKLKQSAEHWVGPEYEEYVHFLSHVRSQIKQLAISPESKADLLKRLLDDRFLEWTRDGNIEDRDALAADWIQSYLHRKDENREKNDPR